MEIWFIFTLVSLFFLGIHKFISNVVSKKNLNKNNYLFYTAISQIIVNLGYFLYTESYFYMTFMFGFLIILRTILVNEKLIAMMKSLDYIDSSLFFPSQEFLKILGGFFVGIFVFGEYLALNEIIFLIVGFFSVFLLGYKKGELKNKDLKKGIFFMLLSSLFLIGTSAINKYIGENESIALYMLLCSLGSIFYILFKIKISKQKFEFKKQELNYGILTGIIGFLGFVSFLNAVKEGKLVIVQSITTMSILIPIILSYIFLKEEINKYKLLGLIIFIGDLVWLYFSR